MGTSTQGGEESGGCAFSIYVFVMVRLDWSLTALKNMVKEGLKRFLYGVDKATGGCALVSMIGITPHYADYEPTKVKTVTFNRCLKDVVRDCSRQWKVGYLPLHLHFLQEAGGFIEPLRRYFSEKSEFTQAGGFVLRQMLLKLKVAEFPKLALKHGILLNLPI